MIMLATSSLSVWPSGMAGSSWLTVRISSLAWFWMRWRRRLMYGDPISRNRTMPTIGMRKMASSQAIALVGLRWEGT